MVCNERKVTGERRPFHGAIAVPLVEIFGENNVKNIVRVSRVGLVESVG